MASKLTDLFDNKQRALGKRALDFFDGRSKEYTQQYLNTYRKNALGKGMKARTRNLVKPVVEKSGMLFAGKPPQLKVYPSGGIEQSDAATTQLQTLMDKLQYVEYHINFDSTVRLLKTCLTLVQYDSETGEVFFTLLSPANCAVHIENREIETLIYYTGRKEEVDTYRVWTKDIVQDIEVTTGSSSETVVAVTDNPYGVIPVAPGHDTNLPRDGFWNPIPEDLLEIQEIYNLHITNAEYAISHAELQTLFTNAQIQGSIGALTSQEVEYGSKLGPRMVTTTGGQGFVGGPGEAVAVETQGGEPVYLEYKGPTPDIKPFDEVITGWFRDYASDWNVTIEDDAAGNGGAVSGFHLVVKEIPNTELRKKRARMFEAYFKRLYEVLLIINDKFGIGLTPNTELYVEFQPPELPQDEKSSEDIWSIKIKEGRASHISYFMTQHGQTREEAEATVKQLVLDEALLQDAKTVAGLTPPKVKPATTVTAPNGDVAIRTAV
jgi:hypothetical protein